MFPNEGYVRSIIILLFLLSWSNNKINIPNIWSIHCRVYCPNSKVALFVNNALLHIILSHEMSEAHKNTSDYYRINDYNDNLHKDKHKRRLALKSLLDCLFIKDFYEIITNIRNSFQRKVVCQQTTTTFINKFFFFLLSYSLLLQFCINFLFS